MNLLGEAHPVAAASGRFSRLQVGVDAGPILADVATGERTAVNRVEHLAAGLLGEGQTENDVPEGYFRTWVERYHRSDWRMTNPEIISANPLVDPTVISPDGGKEGFPVATDESGKYFFVPKLCNHCADSPCTQVCPVGATFISPDGVVLVDQKYCLGCAYCVQACPYGCRYIHPQKKVADKCTLCYHRITQGLTTACCEACPTGARQLADLKDPKDPIHEFLKTHSVQVLKPQMATGAKVFYNDLDGSVR